MASSLATLGYAVLGLLWEVFCIMLPLMPPNSGPNLTLDKAPTLILLLGAPPPLGLLGRLGQPPPLGRLDLPAEIELLKRLGVVARLVQPPPRAPPQVAVPR
mgnify:CR=1 FL=1